jgi:hypothetical protein
MTFLTSQPDLSGTIYSNINLDAPRQYLLDVINIVDSVWLDEPQGPLGEYWNSDDEYAACYLIWIANMLVTVASYISPDSMPQLVTKFSELLHAKSEEQFLQTRAELEVAWALVARASPIVLEPLASDNESRESSDRPQPPLKSPDIAFDLTDERVYTEVTFFSVGILEKWQKAVDFITSTIQNRLFKKGRSLKIFVQLPLQDFDTDRIIQRVWNEICTSGDTGKLTVIENGTISWEPYLLTPLQEDLASSTEGPSAPEIQVTPDGGWEILFRFKALKENPTGYIEFLPSGLSYTSDYFVDKASFVREPDIVVLSEKDVHRANTLILKAFRNKLHDKREQYTHRHKNPYMLVIKLGHYRLQGKGLIQMIERDIWTKQDYKWVTGIILFTSRRGFLPTDSAPQLEYNFNPNADCPASDAMKSLFDGTAQFHRH